MLAVTVTIAGPSKPKGKAIAPEAPSEQGLLAAEQEDHRGAQNPETPEVSGDDNASGDDNDTPMGDNELRRLREELRQEKTRREAVEEASKDLLASIFAHQMEANTVNYGEEEQHLAILPHIDPDLLSSWLDYCETEQRTKKWADLKEFLDEDLVDRANRTFNSWIDLLRIRKQSSESDDEYLRRFNLIVSEIGEEAKDIEKMKLMVVFNGLDPAMKEKLREHSDFPESQQDLRTLTKRLRATLDSPASQERRKESRRPPRTPILPAANPAQKTNVRAASEPGQKTNMGKEGEM
ncbi:MAG: hypothetical protein MMC33_002674 [Icmadophila ericetorum]|nr:hypothetical protein [Icmadophila ericetorum]